MTPNAPSAYRPAPTPPQAVTPALDRSTSQRTPSKPAKPAEPIGRSNTTRDRPSPGQPPVPAQQKTPKPSPGSSTTDLSQGGSASGSGRERDPRLQQQQQQQQPSPAVQSLAKNAGVATPRRREKKVDKEKEGDIVKRLQQICTDADPTRLYRSLVKIGQGYVFSLASRCFRP